MYDLRVKRFVRGCYPDEFMGFTGMDHEYSGMDIDDEIDVGGAV
jgi:hypothetical protein